MIRLDKIYAFNVAIALFIILIVADTSLAQVGGPGACTNFTCRYGECEQFTNDYQCHCFTGVKGKNCNLLLVAPDDLCLSSPCWGGAPCKQNQERTDWSCLCPAGRTGKNCRQIDPTSATTCKTNPCKNGGICTVSNSNQPICYCLQGFTGQYCQEFINTCDRPNPCYNGARCDPAQNRCICPANFTGTQCETFVPPARFNKVRVLNKGWYVARIYIYYEVQNGISKEGRSESNSIAALQEQVYWVPVTANYDSVIGVNLIATAVAGVQIMNLRVPFQSEVCYHVWGTTLFPAWAQINC